MKAIDLIKEIEDARVHKIDESFVTTHRDENGVEKPLGIKLRDRYSPVGLALKQAAANAAKKSPTHRGGLESHSS